MVVGVGVGKVSSSLQVLADDIATPVGTLTSEYVGRVGQQRLTIALEYLRQKTWREGELVAFARHDQRFNIAK